jgi:hypothetical protein
MDLISMIKDSYHSYVVAGEGRVALEGGDAQTAYQKFDEAYNKNLDVLATGTLALAGIGVAAVSAPAAIALGTVQVVSMVTDWGSNVAKSHGYTKVADTLNIVSDVTDLHSHVRKVWDVGFNAYQNPQAALQQTTNFVDHSANQVKDAAHNLYEGAVAKVNNLTNWAGGFISA